MNFTFNPYRFLKYLNYRRKVMQEIRAYRSMEGWLTAKEAVYLHHFATLLPTHSQILEIGSWKGKSTFCLAKGLKSGVVHAIDPFNADGEEGSIQDYSVKKSNTDLEGIFTKNLTDRKVINKVKTHKGYSSAFINNFKEIDLLFIDGDHSIDGAKFDYENYAKLLKKGGYLIFHDYFPQRKQFGPVWVVNNLVQPSKEFEFIDLYDSLWVGRKI